MKLLALTGVVFFLGSTGCGSKMTSYDYQFSATGCETGTQTFTSLEAMCTALQSDSVNNNCALSARQDFFQKQSCPGTFQETP